MTAFEQHKEGAMTYPAQGTLGRLFFKAPLVLWRMGLGSVIGEIAPVMILTARGRKSGLPRHTGLAYEQIEGIRYANSAWGAESDWYRNVVADPHVTLQTGEGVEHAYAYRVTDLDEYKKVAAWLLEYSKDPFLESWLESVDIAHDLDDMIAKRDRVYLVGFRPADEPGPAPLEKDLVWLWPVLAVTFVLGWLLGRLR
jgi:deazaflavin-dependent oxidoreductase (nitroreductase family)